jgi:hypothetical protein
VRKIFTTFLLHTYRHHFSFHKALPSIPLCWNMFWDYCPQSCSGITCLCNLDQLYFYFQTVNIVNVKVIDQDPWARFLKNCSGTGKAWPTYASSFALDVKMFQ